VTVLVLAIGIAAGVLAGLFGIGGGVIMVVGMVAVLGFPFLTATGTSLAAMLLPVGVFGVLEFHRRGNVDLRAALLLACGLTLGTWLGSRLAHLLNTAALQRGFAVFLLVMAVRMWITAK
jgi:uncharacterized membrane protein YfcA